MSQLPTMISAASDAAAYMLAKHALPLGLKCSSNDSPLDGAKRGTFTLLHLPQRDVFVTCFHVLNAFRELQANDPSAQMVAYLTSSPRLVELKGFSLIDCDQRSLDVATFGGSDDFVELPGMRFIDFATSYLPDPVVGDVVSIVGYPGANVTMSQNMAKFGLMHIGFRVSCVSERQVILANENGDRSFFDFHDPRNLGANLGGLSGSPAFVTRDNKPRFVGIVTDCSDRDQTILISRLGCLKPDGTLDHTAIPW